MKTMYERMSKKEKKDLEYKSLKGELVKKMERMFTLCWFGIGYSIIAFFYDLYINQSKFLYWIDILIFVFCIIVIIKVYSTKKDLLNNYALEKMGYKKKKNKKS